MNYASQQGLSQQSLLTASELAALRGQANKAGRMPEFNSMADGDLEHTEPTLNLTNGGTYARLVKGVNGYAGNTLAKRLSPRC